MTTLERAIASASDALADDLTTETVVRAALLAIRDHLDEAILETVWLAGQMQPCNSEAEAKALFRAILWPAAIDAILKEGV